MKIQYIDVKHVNVMWPYLEPYITLTIEESGIHEYSAEQFKVRLIDGVWNALVAVDNENQIQGAAVVNFFNRPDARVGFIVAIGGKLITSPDTVEQLKMFMKQHGATKIEGNVRESVARLLARYGFKEKYRVVGVSV
jgi:hypothetical protein